LYNQSNQTGSNPFPLVTHLSESQIRCGFYDILVRDFWVRYNEEKVNIKYTMWELTPFESFLLMTVMLLYQAVIIALIIGFVMSVIYIFKHISFIGTGPVVKVDPRTDSREKVNRRLLKSTLIIILALFLWARPALDWMRTITNDFLSVPLILMMLALLALVLILILIVYRRKNKQIK